MEPKTRFELATALEVMRMQGVAHNTTAGLNLTRLTPLSFDELRALYAKARREKAAITAAHAERMAREKALADATHQTVEQARTREDERRVRWRSAQHARAHESEARERPLAA